jgi:broad specificity phosphatase PhoE
MTGGSGRAPAGTRLLFLVRHGRSDEANGDLTDTPRGPQWDPPLDDVGRRQAGLLARRLLLMDPQPEDVVCSSMRRARETIAPYEREAGRTAELDAELIEAHIGDWEAKSFEEVLGSDQRMLQRFRDQDAIWEHAPGAEPVRAFRGRVVEAIERVLGVHERGNVLVVAHGGVINAYVGHVLGLDQAMFFLPENTSLNTIEVAGRRRRVRFLNDDRHLVEPGLFEPRTGPLAGERQP